MSEDIKNYVKKCPICEKMKITTNVEVPLQISSMGETLFDHTFIDFVGPISPTKKKFKYVFTMGCDLTQFMIAIPAIDCTAVTAGCLLLVG